MARTRPCLVQTQTMQNPKQRTCGRCCSSSSGYQKELPRLQPSFMPTQTCTQGPMHPSHHSLHNNTCQTPTEDKSTHKAAVAAQHLGSGPGCPPIIWPHAALFGAVNHATATSTPSMYAPSPAAVKWCRPCAAGAGSRRQAPARAGQPALGLGALAHEGHSRVPAPSTAQGCGRETGTGPVSEPVLQGCSPGRHHGNMQPGLLPLPIACMHS
jgi:hypothetical protein